MNQKGVGTVVTWMFALFIITVFSIIFIAAFYVLNVRQSTGLGVEQDLVLRGGTRHDNYIRQDLYRFLERKVPMGDEVVTVRQLVEGNDPTTGLNRIWNGDAASSAFNEEALAFLKETYGDPSDPENTDWFSETWLGVFDFDDPKTSRGQNQNTFFVGGLRCSEEPSQTEFVYVKGKKVGLCIKEQFLLERGGRNE